MFNNLSHHTSDHNKETQQSFGDQQIRENEQQSIEEILDEPTYEQSLEQNEHTFVSKPNWVHEGWTFILLEKIDWTIRFRSVL